MALDDTNGMAGLGGADATASPDVQPTTSAPIAGDLVPPAGATAQPDAQQPTASPVQGELQQPESPAAPQPSGITPAGQNFQRKKPNFFKSYGQAFAGAILSGLAGNEKTSYRVDDNPESPNYGKTITEKTPMGRADKLRAIAQNALIGLISAENTPAEPGGELSAGIAGGAAGVMNYQAQQDTEKRKQATDEFKQQQTADANKALKARNTIAIINDTMDAIQKGEDRDPAYKTNLAIFDAVKDPTYGIPGTRVVTDKELQAMAASDHDWLHKFIPISLGKTVTGMDARTSQPIVEGRIALIPQDGQGKIAIPAALATDIQKYGKKYISGADQLTAGAFIGADRLPAILAAVATGRTDARAADAKPNLVIPQGKEDKGANLMRQNSVTGELTPADATERQKYDDDLLLRKKTQSEIDKNNAEAEKNRKLAEMAGDALVAGVDPTDGVTKVVSGKEAAVGNFDGVRKVTATQIDGYSRDHSTMNDIQAKMNLVLPSLRALDQDTFQTGIIADALAHPEETILRDVVDKKVRQKGTPLTRQFILGVLGLRESIFGMQRLQTGSARPNGEQIKALLKTLPGPTTPDSRFGLQQLQRVELDIDRRRVSIPMPPGMAAEPIPPQFNLPSTHAAGPAGAPPANLLKEGVNTTFKNGQTWTLKDGVPTQVTGAQ